MRYHLGSLLRKDSSEIKGFPAVCRAWEAVHRVPGWRELDEIFMTEALGVARQALRLGEVPVGAVVVLKGETVARAHNLCETLQDPTAHAEMLAIRRAAGVVGSYRLLGAELFVTVEPCLMCAGGLILARVARVVYGCPDPKGGALGSCYQLHLDYRLNHRLEVKGRVLEGECRDVMHSFFSGLRGKRTSPRR